MVRFDNSFFSGVISIMCFAAAITLAYTGIGGWGWFLVIGFLLIL